MQQFCAVLFVLLALLGAVAFLRRKGFAVSSVLPRGSRRDVVIAQVDKMRLGPQHSVHLLQVDNRKLLIAVHPQGVTVLLNCDGNHAVAKGC